MNRSQLYYLEKVMHIISWSILIIGIIICLMLPWWSFLILATVFLCGVIFAGHLGTLAGDKTEPDDLIFDDESPKTGKQENGGKDSSEKKRDNMIFDED